MKPKLNITLLFVGGLLACSASNVAPGNAPSSGALLDAIARVESGNDPAAVGDGGRATGAWQMHAAARADARALLRVPATATVTDRDLARAYLAHLNARLTKALKRQPSAAESYAAWNLGYTGFKRRGFQVERCPAVTRKAAAKISIIVTKNNFQHGAVDPKTANSVSGIAVVRKPTAGTLGRYRSRRSPVNAHAAPCCPGFSTDANQTKGRI